MRNKLSNLMIVIGVMLIIMAVFVFMASTGFGGTANMVPIALILLVIGIMLLVGGRVIKKMDNKIIHDYEVEEIAKSEIEKALERDSPLEILKKRYASGEISEEEFKKMKKNLE